MTVRHFRARSKAALVASQGLAWFAAHFRFLRAETVRGPDGVFSVEIYEVL
jgi:hypothetical protein